MLLADHFNRLYNLDEMYKWEKFLCFNKRRVEVEDYVNLHKRIDDNTFAHFDPENHIDKELPEGEERWSILDGWIAEVRMNGCIGHYSSNLIR